MEGNRMGEIVGLKAADDHEFSAYHVAAADDGDRRPLLGHRELFALSDRPGAGRAAADPVRISAR